MRRWVGGTYVLVVAAVTAVGWIVLDLAGSDLHMPSFIIGGVAWLLAWNADSDYRGGK